MRRNMRRTDLEEKSSADVAKRHEGVKKQHGALFFPECDRAAARPRGVLGYTERGNGDRIKNLIEFRKP